MTLHDDETEQMYLEESLEHLADIENDLSAIEADGTALNEDLVNWDAIRLEKYNVTENTGR